MQLFRVGGTPSPQPSPSGYFDCHQITPSLLRQRQSSAPICYPCYLLPLPSPSLPRHPRRSGDPEPLLSSTRLKNGGPASAPATRHCCPNRVGALSGLWIPAAARMTGAARMTRHNRKQLPLLPGQSHLNLRVLIYQHFHPEPLTPHPESFILSLSKDCTPYPSS